MLHMIKSQLNDDFYKTILNIRSNETSYTMIPYAYCDIAKIDYENHCIILYQDNKETNDHLIKMTMDYNGNIISQETLMTDNLIGSAITEYEKWEQEDNWNDDYDKISDDGQWSDLFNLLSENKLNNIKSLKKHEPEDRAKYGLTEISERYDNFEALMEQSKIELREKIDELRENIELGENYEYYYEYNFNNSKLTVFGSVLYIISNIDTGSVTNILFAPDYSLQMGDCDTHLYLLNNRHLLIQNAGDVNSAIFIKMVEQDE